MIARGAGVAVALEGGFSVAQTRAKTGAAWAYDYQPVTSGVAMIRSSHYAPQSADGSVSGAWWGRVIRHIENPDAFTLALNEPPNADQDNWTAATAARILHDDFVERIQVYDPKAQFGKTPLILPVRWAGFGCMGNIDSHLKWERDYRAAGGPKPPIFHTHLYAWDGAGLRSDLARYDSHLSALWPDRSGRDILITETGHWPGLAAYPDMKPTTARVIDILQAAFDLLKHPRVLGFAWFSSRYPGSWAHNDLLKPDGTLTAIGHEFRRLATGAPTIDPIPDKFIYFPTINRQ